MKPPGGRRFAPSARRNNASLAFFNLAKHGAKPRMARKITTYVAILSSHPCDVAACRIDQKAAIRQSTNGGRNGREKQEFFAKSLPPPAKQKTGCPDGGAANDALKDKPAARLLEIAARTRAGTATCSVEQAMAQRDRLAAELIH